MLLIIGLFALILGIVMIWAPEKIFKIYERLSWETLKYPEERYIANICTNGLSMVLVGGFTLFVFFLM